jgi:hypothetical protein
MNSFVFNVPTRIYFGENQLGNLGPELEAYGKKVLVCYGGGSIKRIGLYDKIMAELHAGGFEVFELAGIDPNPRIESVREGAAICKENGVDVVLAVGGGSTIDCAKFVCAGAKSDRDPWDWFANKKTPITDALPLVTVLTVAATGSEMDNGGVISNLSINQKIGRSAKVLQPKVSFLDPTVTYSVNAFHTAAGSADIMSHTIETYFSLDDDLYFLDTFMEGLLKTIVKYAPVAVKDPENYEARANLMWASSWAINGMGDGGKTQAWSCHPMEHELSAFYDITHGLGLAILTPRWMRHTLNEKTLPRFVQYAENVFDIPKDLHDEEKAELGIKRTEEFLYGALGLESNLTALGIDSEHFQEMADHACAINGGVIRGFQPLEPADVVAIYSASL